MRCPFGSSTLDIGSTSAADCAGKPTCYQPTLLPCCLAGCSLSRLQLLLVVAVILPGWYPSRMATGNSTHILEAFKCPQKYIWYVDGVICMQHSCCPTPWALKGQSRWSEDSRSGACSVQLRKTIHRDTCHWQPPTSAQPSGPHAAGTSIRVGLLSRHRGVSTTPLVWHLPTLYAACMLAAGLRGKRHGAQCRVLAFFVFAVCCSAGGVPTAAFDPAKPTALEGTTVQLCPYGTFTQELGSTSLDQCCKCTRTQRTNCKPFTLCLSTCTQALTAARSS